eukprot:TRINITY_DN3560_c0_g1_i2.p1 TRINITY_DN3560_c0_g1~~TRINITY_DN3560_c0_g1_i2.p1  ORF type:complete len:492 (+),score=100.05 TRINITY_DN3560_c0_g1_i2:418-1893(+)
MPRGTKQDMEALFAKSKARLASLWQELHIPRREQELFARQFFDPPSPANHAHISLQISRLLEHRSATLEVLKSIDIRETHLSQLHELAGIMAEMRQGGSDYSFRGIDAGELGAEVGKVLGALRWVTVECTEAMLAWRHGLTRPYPFLWKGLNYMIKMLTDIDFIHTSDLGRLVTFAQANNPLLLPTEPGGQRSRRALAGCSELQMQRIRAAERVIMDEENVQIRRQEQEEEFRAKGIVTPTLRYLTSNDDDKNPQEDSGSENEQHAPQDDDISEDEDASEDFERAVQQSMRPSSQQGKRPQSAVRINTEPPSTDMQQLVQRRPSASSAKAIAAASGKVSSEKTVRVEQSAKQSEAEKRADDKRLAEQQSSAPKSVIVTIPSEPSPTPQAVPEAPTVTPSSTTAVPNDPSLASRKPATATTFTVTAAPESSAVTASATPSAPSASPAAVTTPVSLATSLLASPNPDALDIQDDDLSLGDYENDFDDDPPDRL